MKNISDIIEDFILELFDDEVVNLSRNELANYFNVSPSQINYVLSTRFTPFRGFDIESRRGGGGYIRIYKLSIDNKDDFLQQILSSVGDKLDYLDALHLLDNLQNRQYINLREYNILKSIVSPKILSSPIKQDDIMRAKIFKSIVVDLMKEE